MPCVCAMCHARATPMPCTSHIRTAPFQRVWIALLELETPFTHEIIDLADKPSEFLRLSELASGGKGKSTVPLLEMGEDVVSESLDIVRLLGKAALSKGPGSQQPTLHPPAPAARSTYK
jgi:glutathione S-transferase